MKIKKSENKYLTKIETGTVWFTNYLYDRIGNPEFNHLSKKWPDYRTYSKEDWEVEIERRNDAWNSHMNEFSFKANKWLKERFVDMMRFLCEVDYLDLSCNRVHFLLSDGQISQYPISRELGCMNVEFWDKGAWGLDHPIPPSVNKMYVVRSNKMVKSKIYKDWLNDNLDDFKTEYHHYKTGWAESVGVEILANLPRNRDLDNIVKPIIDAFVIAKIIPDDNFVDFVLTRRSKKPPEGYFQINISEIFENEKYWDE